VAGAVRDHRSARNRWQSGHRLSPRSPSATGAGRDRGAATKAGRSFTTARAIQFLRKQWHPEVPVSGKPASATPTAAARSPVLRNLSVWRFHCPLSRICSAPRSSGVFPHAALCEQGLCHSPVRALQCEAVWGSPAAGRVRTLRQGGPELPFWQTETPPECDWRLFLDPDEVPIKTTNC